MINKVESFAKEHKMIEMEDCILVAVSGGPDSMCLLDILRRLKSKYKLKLIAAHVNHCVRGKEADEDEDFVGEYCRTNGIPFESIKVEVEKLAKEKRISSEMAGREVRYSFFENLKEKHGCSKIALAHNANDVGETMLMRIFRGTGIRGLEGIKPVRDGVFIRPVLCLERCEIETYCTGNNINARIDATNLENIYSRNKVRLDLIPYIKEHFNEDILNTLLRLSKNVTRDNEYLDLMAGKVFEEHCTVGENEVLIKKELFNEHEAVVTRCIRKAIEVIQGDMNNLEQVHIYDIIELSKKESGKEIDLPRGMCVMNSFGNLIVHKKEKSQKSNEEIELLTDCITKGYELKIYDIGKVKIKKNSKYTKYFDYDKIKGNIYLRKRRQGDTIVPFGMTGRKKIKKIFSEKKIPPHLRDEVDFICCSDGVMWVVGCITSNIFKIDHKTKKVLEIKFKGEKMND